MAAPGPPQGPGRGIHIAGHDNFNNRLMSRLSLAPADLMHFLEACAMGNLARVESLLERGVEVFYFLFIYQTIFYFFLWR